MSDTNPVTIPVPATTIPIDPRLVTPHAVWHALEAIRVEQRHTTDERELARRRARNNPGDKPTGHYTGRCKECGSNDLWDDNAAYGCNSCGAAWCF